MSKEFLESLALFNEKSEKLLKSRFLDHLKEKGMNVNLQINSSGGSLKHNLPDQESIDAFVLNLRYFIQDNEISSLRNLAALYNSSGLPQGIKDEFNFARNRLNEELDKESNISIDKKLTNRDIFDTFIYGGIAHASQDKEISEKKKKYDSWMGNKYANRFLEMSFNSILFYVLNVIAYIRKTNLKAMEELSSEKP